MTKKYAKINIESVRKLMNEKPANIALLYDNFANTEYNHLMSVITTHDKTETNTFYKILDLAFSLGREQGQSEGYQDGQASAEEAIN